MVYNVGAQRASFPFDSVQGQDRLRPLLQANLRTREGRSLWRCSLHMYNEECCNCNMILLHICPCGIWWYVTFVILWHIMIWYDMPHLYMWLHVYAVIFLLFAFSHLFHVECSFACHEACMKKLHKKCEGKGRAKTHSVDENVQVGLINVAGITHARGGDCCNPELNQ